MSILDFFFYSFGNGYGKCQSTDYENVMYSFYDINNIPLNYFILLG